MIENAKIHTVKLGNRKLTKSMFKQLDVVRYGAAFTPLGRVSLRAFTHTERVVLCLGSTPVVGVDRVGNLVRGVVLDENAADLPLIIL
ncbi:hypothetical protein ACWDTP_05015 [Mycobacterium sp. NPDC003449]